MSNTPEPEDWPECYLPVVSIESSSSRGRTMTECPSIRHRSVISLSKLQEDYDMTGQAFSECMVNPIDGVEMQWFLQWKIEERFNSHHCLSLALEVEIMELLIERPGDIWISLDSLQLCFKSESENSIGTSNTRQLVSAHSTAQVMLSKPGDKYKVYLLHPNHPQESTCILPMHRVCLSNLPEGSLTLSLQLSVVFCSIAFVNKTCIPHRFPQNGSKIGAMLTTSEEESKGKYSDITLVATMSSKLNDSDSMPPIKFYAHKVILAAQSPVFARMFEHGMSESVTNEVIISDISSDVLKEMLTFMYTNKAPNIHKIGCSLLYAADKYQIDELVAQCEQVLSHSITVENSIDLLLCAHAHNAFNLKWSVMRYIAEHGEEVFNSKDWDKVKEHAELLNELIQTIFQESKPPSKKQKLS